jgi:hypothetical protein
VPKKAPGTLTGTHGVPPMDHLVTNGCSPRHAKKPVLWTFDPRTRCEEGPARTEGCVWGLRKKGVGHWDTPYPGSNTRTDHLAKDVKCLSTLQQTFLKYGVSQCPTPCLNTLFKRIFPCDERRPLQTMAIRMLKRKRVGHKVVHGWYTWCVPPCPIFVFHSAIDAEQICLVEDVNSTPTTSYLLNIASRLSDHWPTPRPDQTRRERTTHTGPPQQLHHPSIARPPPGGRCVSAPRITCSPRASPRAIYARPLSMHTFAYVVVARHRVVAPKLVRTEPQDVFVSILPTESPPRPRGSHTGATARVEHGQKAGHHTSKLYACL